VPAAAVIPAPIAYIKAVAVKKLVVGSRDATNVRPAKGLASAGLFISTFWPPVPLVGSSWNERGE